MGNLFCREGVGSKGDEEKETDCSCNLYWASAGHKQGVKEILRGPAGAAERMTIIFTQIQKTETEIWVVWEDDEFVRFPSGDIRDQG